MIRIDFYDDDDLVAAAVKDGTPSARARTD